MLSLVVTKVNWLYRGLTTLQCTTMEKTQSGHRATRLSGEVEGLSSDGPLNVAAVGAFTAVISFCHSLPCTGW
jgi:hypothetical protein